MNSLRKFTVIQKEHTDSEPNRKTQILSKVRVKEFRISRLKSINLQVDNDLRNFINEVNKIKFRSTLYYNLKQSFRQHLQLVK